MNMTLREKTMAKLDIASDGQEIGFDPREAKLAGMFTEDAIDLEAIFDDREHQENNKKNTS